LQSSLNFLPVEAGINAYWNSREISAEQLLDLQQRTAVSMQLHDHYRFGEALGLLHYLQALQEEGTLNERRLAFEATIASGIESLESAPVQPQIWLRLAHAGARVFWPAEDVTAAYRMAIYTGRVEPMHLMSRLALGYALVSVLDDEGIRLLRDQTVLAWQHRQREFAGALKDGSMDFRRIQAVLEQSHPDVLLEMEEALGDAVR
jgi:hypothetical protein